MHCIDLHIHSAFSDGLLAPAEIVKRARKAQLLAISLTDHDTTAGLPDFLAQKSDDMALVAGIELSAHHHLASSHILGYGIQYDFAPLGRKLHQIQAARERRNRGILEKLNNMGIEISYAEVNRVASGQMGRPHIASVLTRKGVVRNEQEAFIRFLRKGGPAFVEREQLPVQEAIGLIKQAGGIAVLAHPGCMDPTCIFLPQLIRELKDNGLDGIEVYHPTHNPKHIRFFNDLCAKLDLVATGGSDFHGRERDRCELGRYGPGKCIGADLWLHLKTILQQA